MKKSYQIIILLFLSIYSLSAQNKINAQLGVGPNSFYSSDDSEEGGLPVCLGIVYKVNSSFSLDVQYANSSKKEDYWKFNISFIGLRAFYHFGEVLKLENTKLDVYAGPQIGQKKYVYSEVYRGISDEESDNEIKLGLAIGGKYYFTKNVGAYLEGGIGNITNAQFGLALRF